jgi:carbamoyltransferase
MRILSIFDGHDASATVLNNGVIEHYLKEERFSKVKKDKKIDNIFKICLENFVYKCDYFIFRTNDTNEVKDDKNKIIQQKNKNIILINSNTHHHLYHASIAFYNSGFERSVVLVVDSSGAILKNMHECESVYILEYPDKITPIYKNHHSSIPQNLDKSIDGCRYICKSQYGIGNLYDGVAMIMGQTIDDCGKAMGLSSYGNRIPDFINFFDKTIDEPIVLLNDAEERLFFNLIDNGKNVKITEDNYQFYADYCLEVQVQTQEAICKLVKNSIEKTGIKNVCISGGYGMNIISNHLLTKRFPNINFYFEPLCDDGGISIGAAMYAYRKITKDSQIIPIKNTFVHGFKYDISQYKGTTVDIKQLAKILYNNKSVAIYNDLAESGQRALGNRSILFNALNLNAKEIVNGIKKREWYRPFAAIVLEEDADQYFDMGDLKSNPFMTVCFPVKTDIIPGVTHVDKTCRVQTVNSGHLKELLLEFKKISGHGILLNTSFNLAGEPLVETPEDAFKTLNNSSLDYLWFYESKQLFNSYY